MCKEQRSAVRSIRGKQGRLGDVCASDTVREWKRYTDPLGFIFPLMISLMKKRSIRFFHSQACSMWTKLYFHKWQISLTRSPFLTCSHSFCGEVSSHEGVEWRYSQRESARRLKMEHHIYPPAHYKRYVLPPSLSPSKEEGVFDVKLVDDPLCILLFWQFRHWREHFNECQPGTGHSLQFAWIPMIQSSYVSVQDAVRAKGLKKWLTLHTATF